MGMLKGGTLVKFVTSSRTQVMLHVWVNPNPPCQTFVVGIGSLAVFLGRTKGRGLAQVLTPKGVGYVNMEHVGCVDEKKHVL